MFARNLRKAKFGTLFQKVEAHVPHLTVAEKTDILKAREEQARLLGFTQQPSSRLQQLYPGSVEAKKEQIALAPKKPGK